VKAPHSFINSAVLQGQKCKVWGTHPLVVMVANGEIMIIDFVCASLLFFIQGCEFAHELRLLLVTGYDMILGLDWLSQFGPMTMDWKNKWVEIPRDNTTIRLQAQEEHSHIHMCE